MTKEERIEIAKIMIEKYEENLVGYDYPENEIIKRSDRVTNRWKVQIEALEVLLKLLSIPKRDINNLQVGDVVFYLNAFGNFTRQIMQGLEWVDEFKQQANGYKFEILQIIPNEFLEIWREINHE